VDLWIWASVEVEEQKLVPLVNAEHERCFGKRLGAVVIEQSSRGGLETIKLVEPEITAS
jgi:hypothetical protein